MAVNAWDEPKDLLAKYAEKEKLAQRILLEGSDVADTYGITGLPATLWVNRQGVVVDTEMGFEGAEALKVKTERLLTDGK